jgi:hypothetical protein
MKKVFFMLTVVALISSCSKQNEELTIATNGNDIKLLTSLISYNKKNNVLQVVDCEGFWDCLGHVTAVAGADIAGAGAGVVGVAGSATALNIATGGTAGTVVLIGAGAISGAGASYLAHKTIKALVPAKAAVGLVNANFSYIEYNASYKFGNLDIVIPTSYRYLENVGKHHNMVIHNSFFNNEPLSSYYNYLNLNLSQRQLFQSENFRKINNKIEQASIIFAENNFDYKEFTQTMVDKKLFTKNMKDVLDLFLTSYIGSTDFGKIERLINFYIIEVSNSQLNELEKQALITSFIVASQSPFYML